MGLGQKENRPSLDCTQKRVGPCIEDFYLVVPRSMAISVQHDPLWDQQNSSQSVGTQATQLCRPVPRAVQTVQVHSVINLKDQAIAKVVTTHQARAANRSGTGASLFDPTMGVLPIGMA